MTLQQDPKKEYKLEQTNMIIIKVIVISIIIGGYLIIKKRKSFNTTTSTTTLEPEGCVIYTIYNTGKADNAYNYIECTTGLKVNGYLGSQAEIVLKCAKTGSLNIEGKTLVMSKKEC